MLDSNAKERNRIYEEQEARHNGVTVREIPLRKTKSATHPSLLTRAARKRALKELEQED